MRRIVRWAATAGLVIALAALGGCAGKKDVTGQNPGSSTTSSQTSSPPTSASGSPTTSKTRRPGVTPTATSTAAGGPGVGGNSLPKGKHFGFYVSSTTGTVDGRPVTVLAFDKAELLTGAEATKAAKAHGGDPEVPNDAFVVNDNAAVRILPLRHDANVLVLKQNLADDWILAKLSDLSPDRFPIDIQVVTENGVTWVTEVREHFMP